MSNTDVYIKVFGNGKIPVYGSENSAGCDLFATEDMVIKPGETKIMPLDFIIAVEADIEVQIRPRSGLSLKTDLRIANTPGTVDSDFRDPVGLILQNNYSNSDLVSRIIKDPKILEYLKDNYTAITLSEYLYKLGISLSDEIKTANTNILSEVIYIDKNENPYGTIYIKKGDRVAQMVCSKFKKAVFIPHDNPEVIGNNRGGGFGHTGI